MKTRKMKRLISLFLAMLMVLSMTFTSLAAVNGSVRPEVGSSGIWSVNAEGRWSFATKDGPVQNGWFLCNSGNNSTEYKWYCFDENGSMRTGWINNSQDPSVWYYVSEKKDASEGSMQTGWVTDPKDGRKYYLDPATGVMCSGWQKIGSEWYYFGQPGDASHPYGSMYKNEMTPDGYYVGPSGVWGETSQTAQTAGGGHSSEERTPARKADEEKTIKSLLPGNFPVATIYEGAPSPSWIDQNGTDNLCYKVWSYPDNTDSLGFVTYEPLATLTHCVSVNEIAKKSGDNYVYTSDNNDTITFVMSGNTLKEIIFSGSGDNAIYNGDYLPRTHRITTSVEGEGEIAVTADGEPVTEARTNDHVMVDITPAEGWTLSEWWVNSGSYHWFCPNLPMDFSMIEADLEIEATFKKANESEAEETLTIADILPDDFPSTDSPAYPAPYSWQGDSETLCQYCFGVYGKSQLKFITTEGIAEYHWYLLGSCPVTSSGDNYVYTNGEEVITFIMSEGKLSSIEVTGMDPYNGTYGPVQNNDDENLTIGDLLPDDFPNTDDEFAIPKNKWKASGGGICYGLNGKTQLKFKRTNGATEYHWSLPTSYPVKESGENYVYTGGDVTMTFVISGGTLTEIDVSGSGPYDGKYKAPQNGEETLTIADVLPNDFPFADHWDWSSTPEDAWETQDGKFCYRTNEQICFICNAQGIATSMLLESAVTESGGDYVYGTLIFHMSNGNLVSVEYSSHSPNDEALNGIYTPQNNEEEKVLSMPNEMSEQ